MSVKVEFRLGLHLSLLYVSIHFFFPPDTKCKGKKKTDSPHFDFSMSINWPDNKKAIIIGGGVNCSLI